MGFLAKENAPQRKSWLRLCAAYLLPTKRRGNVLAGVCLSVCLYVCNTITFESLDVESLFLICGYTELRIRVKFVYEGHRVKVKVTAAEKREGPDPLKTQSAITAIL